jgi:hypothetical protein
MSAPATTLRQVDEAPEPPLTSEPTRPLVQLGFAYGLTFVVVAVLALLL